MLTPMPLSPMFFRRDAIKTSDANSLQPNLQFLSPTSPSSNSLFNLKTSLNSQNTQESIQDIFLQCTSTAKPTIKLHPPTASSANRFFNLPTISSSQHIQKLIQQLFLHNSFKELWDNIHKNLLLSSPVKIRSLTANECKKLKVAEAHFSYTTVGQLVNNISIEYNENLSDDKIKHCILYEIINISYLPKYRTIHKKLGKNEISTEEYKTAVYKLERKVAKRADKLTPDLFPDHPEFLYGNKTQTSSNFEQFAAEQGHNKLLDERVKFIFQRL
ncbi:MAG: hypothetical protein VX777_08970 [Chlamydiota bacterium]|nr:hypothetical protein [Chlamydiota bacterium]